MFTIECGVVVTFEDVVQLLLNVHVYGVVIRSSSNHVPIKYRGLIQKSKQITLADLIYVVTLLH